jgi:hypothetical protein
MQLQARDKGKGGFWSKPSQMSSIKASRKLRENVTWAILAQQIQNVHHLEGAGR